MKWFALFILCSLCISANDGVWALDDVHPDTTPGVCAPLLVSDSIQIASDPNVSSKDRISPADLMKAYRDLNDVDNLLFQGTEPTAIDVQQALQKLESLIRISEVGLASFRDEGYLPKQILFLRGQHATQEVPPAVQKEVDAYFEKYEMHLRLFIDFLKEYVARLQPPSGVIDYKTLRAFSLQIREAVGRAHRAL